MPRATRFSIAEYWPAILVGAALVVPLFIDTILHAELFLTLVLIGLVTSMTLLLVRGEFVLPSRGLVISLVALAGYFVVRSLFATEPMVSLYGAYSSDGTLLWLAAVTVALLGTYAWARNGDRRDGIRSNGVVWLLISITLYCVASGIAAIMWKSTDIMGGPASGFTPNSQYQVQLLTVGLATSAAWGVLKRSSRMHLVAAGISFAIILMQVLDPRSSVLPVALAVAILYVFSLHMCLRRAVAPVFAGVWTGAVGLTGVAVTTALLVDGFTARTVMLLDTLGNGRGSLWRSAALLFERNPFFGQGLAHATSLTRWVYTDGTFDLTTTTDPHNLFLLLAAGGGLLGVALGLAALYWLQHTLFTSVRRSPAQDRLPRLLLIAGAVAVFVLSQFTFVYPVAWVLCATLLGLVIAAVPPEAPARRSTTSNAVTGVALAAVVVLVAGLWYVVPSRGGSLRLSSQPGVQNPATVLEGQLGLIKHSWDVVPAVAANTLVAQGIASAPEAVAVFRPSVAEKQSLVGRNARWDARLAVSQLRLWSAAADAGSADLVGLKTIIDSGMQADPATGFWASAGADLLARHGFEADAKAYARQVFANPVWAQQAQANADKATYSQLEALAVRE